jgi:hypothetical protein
MLKVEFEKKQLNTWDWYIIQHKGNKKKTTKHNSQSNLILKDEIKKKKINEKRRRLGCWRVKLKRKEKKRNLTTKRKIKHKVSLLLTIFF